MKRMLATLALLSACDQQAADLQHEEPVFPVAASVQSETVTGVANLDDDDLNGEPDWDDGLTEAENDYSTLDIDAAALLAGGGTLTATLAGDGVRVWADGELLLEDGDTAELSVTTLDIEFQDPLDGGLLTLTSTLPGGGTESIEVTLLAAPHLLNHHLQTAELVVAMQDNPGNREFIEGFEAVLGDAFQAVRVSQYGYDVWVQDELELGTMTVPEHRVDVVIDSIRSSRHQGLDDFPEDIFEAPDFVRKTWGSGQPSSQDSFGNMEVSPPVTVDGVE